MGIKPTDPEEISTNKARCLTELFKNRTPARSHYDPYKQSKDDLMLTGKKIEDMSNTEYGKRTFDKYSGNIENNFGVFEEKKTPLKKMRANSDDESFSQNNKKPGSSNYLGGYISKNKQINPNNKQGNTESYLNKSGHNITSEKKKIDNFDEELEKAIEASKKTYEFETKRKIYEEKDDEIYVLDDSMGLKKIEENSNDLATYYNSMLEDQNDDRTEELNASIDDKNMDDITEVEVMDESSQKYSDYTKVEEPELEPEHESENLDEIIRKIEEQEKQKENENYEPIEIEVEKKIKHQEPDALYYPPKNDKKNSNININSGENNKNDTKKYWFKNEFQLMFRLKEEDVTEEYIINEKKGLYF